MRILHLAKKEYDWAIKKGIAKELAPKVLIRRNNKDPIIYEWYTTFLDTLHRTTWC